jgi:hypothetical protein
MPDETPASGVQDLVPPAFAVFVSDPRHAARLKRTFLLDKRNATPDHGLVYRMSVLFR